MTMRPIPPFARVVVTGPPVPLGITSDDYVLMVGVGNEETSSPEPYSNSRDLLLEGVAADSYMHETISDLMGQVSPHVSLATIAPSVAESERPTALRDALRNQVDRLDPVPTTLMVPFYTGVGIVVGTIAAASAVGETDTSITLSAAPTINVDGQLLLIGDEIVRVSNVSGAVLTVERGLFRSDPAAHAVGDSVTDFNGIITSEMEAIASRIVARGVADAPHTSNIYHAIAWSENGNTTPHVMGVNNWHDSHPPSGAWLSAALRVVADNGSQRGIELAHVAGVSQPTQRLAYHHSERSDSEVTQVVAAFLSNIVQYEGRSVILGDTFRGVDDISKYWSTGRQLDRANRVMLSIQAQYIGRAASIPNINQSAVAIQSGVAAAFGPGEIAGVRSIPHPTRNTATNRAMGHADTQTELGLFSPIDGSTTWVTLAPPASFTA